MTIDRRTTLSGLAAGAMALVLPGAVRAQAGGTLDQVKQRGSLRVGVTQAPPWYSKDPKTGEWSSRRRRVHGQGHGRRARREVRAGRGHLGHGHRGAAGQQDRHHVHDGRHARARPGRRLPEDAAAVLLAGRAGARRPAGEGLGRPRQAERAHRRAAGQQHGQVPQRARRQGAASSASPATPKRSPRSRPGAPTRCACSIRRCWPRGRSSAPARSWCRRRRSRRPRARRCARKRQGLRRIGSTSRSAEYYKSGQTQKWYEEFLVGFGLDPKASPPVMKEMLGKSSRPRARIGPRHAITLGLHARSSPMPGPAGAEGLLNTLKVTGTALGLRRAARPGAGADAAVAAAAAVVAGRRS